MDAKRIGIVAAVLVIALTGAACSGSDDDQGASEGGGGVGAPEPNAAVVKHAVGSRVDEESYDQSAGGAALAPSDVADLPSVGPSVIKTAELRIEIARDGVRDAVRKVVDLAGRHGGFVLSSSVDDEGRQGGTVVIRVPAESFEAALGEIDAVGDVEQETVSGQDVSEEFVDLQARLRNFEAQESVLLDLMDRSQSVADTIRVQRELQDAQLEIEQLRGRIRFLEDQTSLATITASLVEAGAVPSHPGTLERAWDRASDTFSSVVAGMIVGVGFLLPLTLLALIAWIGWRVLRPRLA